MVLPLRTARFAAIGPVLLAALGATIGNEGASASADRFSCEKDFRGIELRIADREAIAPETVGHALSLIWERGGLRATEDHVIAEGDTACGVTIRRTGWPDLGRGACATSMISLLEKMNPSVEIDRLQPGEILRLPRVCIETRPYQAEVRREGDGARKLWKLGVPEAGLSEQKASGDYYENVELIRYLVRIPLEDPALATRIVDDRQLKMMRDVSVRPVHIETSGERYKIYDDEVAALLVMPRAFRDAVAAAHGDCPENQEGDLRRLLPSPTLQSCKPTCTPARCPRVRVLDLKAAESHPDLDREWSGADKCDFVLPPDEDSRDRSHATGLLGIIAAKRDGRGLVGVFPAAKAGAVRIQDTEDVPTSDEIFSRIGKPGRWLYVVATGWEDPDPTSHVAMSEAILATQESALWVVAAGQADEGRPGRLLQSGDKEAPMNLGDTANVLVVTACEKCGPGEIALRANSNRSSQFVHVAAPGTEVPTTYLDGRYTAMSGTSPAAAFAGGVAAALWSCSGEKLDAPEMKARLEVTSRPGLMADGQQDWMAGGVVDPDVALLDPDAVWLRRAGADTYEKVEVAAWCNRQASALAIVQPKSGQELADSTPAVSLIRRIVRGDDADESKGWFFYRASIDSTNRLVEWKVKRIGPGTLSPALGPIEARGARKPLLRLEDGSTLSLDSIADLIGNPAIATTRTDCP